MADAAVGLTASTVSTLYIAAAAAPPALTTWHAMLALAIGVPLSLLAAAMPALEGSRVPPTAAMRGNDRLETRRRLPLSALIVPGLTLAGGLRAVAARAGGRPAAVRLRLLVRHHHRRLAPGAGDHLRAGARAARAARAAARRRRAAGARQPGGGDSAPVDLGGGAGRQPLDDGGRRGDDRQLPGDGGLLDRPDAAGRPLHRPGDAAHGRLRADAVRAGDRGGAPGIRTSRRSTRSATSTSSTRATSSRSAPATSTSCSRTARCCSRRRPTDGRPCGGPSAPNR